MIERKGDWMGTYMGGRVWPIDPNPRDFVIEDIAHALSLANRYAGHSKWPYSVAQHSVLCARVALEECPQYAMVTLMHDASEAYIADIVRPAKRDIQGYEDVEERLMQQISKRFQFEWPMPAVVKEIDTRMLVTEAPQIMTAPDGIYWWNDHFKEKPYFGLRVEPWAATYAEDAFLDIFHRIRTNAT